MAREEHIQELMTKLIRAIESSLAASDAVRDTMKELVRQGYDTRLIFVANAENHTVEASPAVFEEGSVQESTDLQFEMTPTDRDFLRSLAISPEE
jgi:hypothetical protein